MRKLKISKNNVRAILYISIASLTALMADLSEYKTFDEISPITSSIIIINFILQGLIAWRAYIDQTISDSKKERNIELDVNSAK
jgi:folate-binding Fe-S cluster repair protein YgfZ